MHSHRIDVNGDPAAREGYERFKRALRLPYYAPPSDAERIAFDTVFDSPFFDFERFLELTAAGGELAQCMKGSRKDNTDGAPKGVWEHKAADDQNNGGGSPAA